MYLAFFMQMLLLLGKDISIVAGSLVLTSSPATATDGELFTMTCTSSLGGVRAWSRGHVHPIFRTQQGQTEILLSSPDISSDVSTNGRVLISVNPDGTQHNVTLKINSRIDSGTAWICTDEIHSETSNTLTIAAACAVTSPTAVVLTSVRSTPSTHTGSSVSSEEQHTGVFFTTTLSGTTPSPSSSPTAVIVAVVATVVVIIVIVVVILCVRRNRRIQARKVTKRANVAPVGNVEEADRSSGDVESHEMSHDERETTDTYASVNKPKKTTFIADNGDIYALPNKPKK